MSPFTRDILRFVISPFLILSKALQKQILIVANALLLSGL